ncbi:hypothetical protein KFL_003520070 [Klebsormidium nitens]|uniref:FAD-binding domain-containing protein n=1 Tax=Klebsormidium nitens TaxID=105231 RepID=A0A1Y1IH08_KLENI|nr:hypothetical protein KFL_003520070 [Klebsormidium nitens]|eukprot:GAQ87428.1 hypothetical protein KFL_003520070 [Klebsormidium nitens]
MGRRASSQVNRSTCTRAVNAELQTESKPQSRADPSVEEEVVVVGGGIAGLSTALALHRMGIKSLVLESAPGPRDSGAAIALWRNAWRALDVLGVGEKLRHDYILLDRVQLCTKKGKVVREFGLDEVKGGPHEYRGVHRSALLKVLASELPEGTVRYGTSVQQVLPLDGGQGTELILGGGERLSAKVVIGCDGTKSAVARHLALPQPNYAGYSAIRGVANFPNGHNQKSAVRQIWGAGVRAGTYPMNRTDVYWFTVFNSPEEEPCPSCGRHGTEAAGAGLGRGWGGDILNIIRATPAEATTRSDIRDRWTLPKPVGGQSTWGRGSVTVAGDAAHPMTPNLGQGGCAALEDAVVLARELAKAKVSNDTKTSQNGHRADKSTSLDPQAVEDVLRRYERERIPRAAKLTVQSWVYGTLLQIGFPPVTFARDNVVVPYLFQPDHWLDHTLYDCGELPTS